MRIIRNKNKKLKLEYQTSRLLLRIIRNTKKEKQKKKKRFSGIQL